VIVLDSKTVAPQEQFSYWVDTITTSFFPIEAERPVKTTEPFAGEIKAKMVGDVLVARHTASAYRLKRTTRSIARRETGMLILGIPRLATVEQTFQSLPPVRAQVGEAVLYDADQALDVWASNGTSEESIFIARERFQPFMGGTGAIPPRVVGADHPLRHMLLATANAFVGLDDVSTQAAEGATQVLVHLIALTYGLDPNDHPTVSHSVSTARLVQARQFIASNLHDPRLNASSVARHIGISVRRLHALYEPLGTGVAAEILAARLLRSKEVLLLRRDAPILQVALACGFYSTSTFYRTFVDKFGLTPGAYRQAGA